MSQAELSTADAPAQPVSRLPATQFEVDPWWPKPLPEGWIIGQCPGVAIDAYDNIVVCNRQDITDEEAESGENAPMVIVFDIDGNVVKH